MASTIKLKRSAIAGKVPNITQLELGELAVNTRDGKLFLKRANGTEEVVEIGARWGSFTAQAAGTTLAFKYNGVTVLTLDSAGNLVVKGDVTAFGGL